MTSCLCVQHAEFMLVVILIGIAIAMYGFGYARAVMHRANKDYKTTKAVVPALRKGFWTAWREAAQVGVWVVLALVFLVYWAWHSVKHPSKDADIKPSPSISTSHRRSR